MCEEALRPCGDEHVTKGRNRKLIPVTSLNEPLKHKCVDLSYYNRYDQIWYRSHISHCLHTPEWSNSQPQVQDAGCRHFGFLGYEKFKKKCQ